MTHFISRMNVKLGVSLMTPIRLACIAPAWNTLSKKKKYDFLIRENSWKEKNKSLNFGDCFLIKGNIWRPPSLSELTPNWM